MRLGTPSRIVGIAALSCLLAGCEGAKSTAQPTRPPASPAELARTAAPTAATAATPATAPLDGLTRGYEHGQRYHYQLKLATAVHLASVDASFDFDLIGRVEVTPVSVTAEVATLYVEFPDLRVVNRAPNTAADLDALVRELRRHGGFFSLAGGRTNAIQVEPEMSIMAASTVREIASAFQFARPRSGENQYRTEEYDSTGPYLAEYEVGPEASRWRKHKLRYLGLLGAGALAPGSGSVVVPRVVRSDGEVRLSSSGRPIHVRRSDEMLVDAGQAPVRSTLTTELDEVEAPTRAPQRNLARLLDHTRRHAADAALVTTPALGTLDEARIGTLDFDTIVTRLEELRREAPAVDVDGPQPDGAEGRERQAQAVKEQGRLFSALGALFRKDPGTVARAAAKIRARSLAADALMDALGSAATPGAHRVLAELLTLPNVHPEVRARIVHSLARTPRPTEEATRALRGLAEREPFHEGALFGLGTHARLLQEAGKLAAARPIGELLGQRLAAADGPAERIIALRAIANSGLDALLPTVEPYLKDPHEVVRGQQERRAPGSHRCGAATATERAAGVGGSGRRHARCRSAREVSGRRADGVLAADAAGAPRRARPDCT
jgi:hypothetical protein